MATLPSFRAPASRRLLPRSCGESRRRGRAAGLPAEGDLPRTPCPERSPAPSHRAAGRAAGGGGGGVKPGEPGAVRSRGPETSGATTPTRRAGHPGPGAGHPPGCRLPLPRGRRRRGRAGSRQQPGPLPGGPRGRQVDCLQADRGASECLGLCVRGLLQMEALFTCQRGPVSLPLGTSVAGLSALGSCRLLGTNGPASPLLRRGIFFPAGPRRSARPAPALRARAPTGLSKRVPRLRSRSS